MEMIRQSNNRNSLNFKCFDMLTSESYCDCTIVADGRFLKAHKIVLAASSAYFKEIFDIIPDKHPAIVLKDVHYKQLQSVMQYIYCGTVDIPTEEVPEFRKILESLKVVFELETDDASENQMEDDSGSEPEVIEPEMQDVIDVEEPAWSDVVVKQEPKDDWQENRDPDDEEDEKPTTSNAKLEATRQLNQKLNTSEQRVFFRIHNSSEGKISVDKVVPSRKIQNFMNSRPLLCPFCRKLFKTSKHRNEHVKYCFDNPHRVHSVCPLCSKSVCDPYYLRKHLKNVHGTTNPANPLNHSM